MIRISLLQKMAGDDQILNAAPQGLVDRDLLAADPSRRAEGSEHHPQSGVSKSDRRARFGASFYPG
jgi:hypothetical protein